jgi:hypothetical protein
MRYIAEPKPMPIPPSVQTNSTMAASERSARATRASGRRIGSGVWFSAGGISFIGDLLGFFLCQLV